MAGRQNTAASFGLFLFAAGLLSVSLLSGAAQAQTAPEVPAASPPDAATVESVPLQVVKQTSPLQIQAVLDGKGHADPMNIGLGDALVIVLNHATSDDASRFVLFLNGTKIDGLSPTYLASDLRPDNKAKPTLTFILERNDKNGATWKTLLGSPVDFHKKMTVSLGELPASADQSTAAGAAIQPAITADRQTPDNASFDFELISWPRLIAAVLIVGFLLYVVWGSARRTSIIKDNQIPQIDTKLQCFSLGRTQMAFWFTLIFACYIFIYIVLQDTDSLTSQALMLMGISGATALAAVAVDAVKDSPADAVNAGLRALGIKSYADVARINAEIAQRTAQLAANPPPAVAQAAQLNSEILDRVNLLRTYEAAIAGFKSTGWYSDIVSDVNGPALHRLQVLCWSALLGLIFLIGVWQNLTMPEFSATLLAVLGISGAGYVGFKYPEAQQ